MRGDINKEECQKGSRIRWKENRRLKKGVGEKGGERGERTIKKGRGNKLRGKVGLLQGAAELRNLLEEGAGRRQVYATGSGKGGMYVGTKSFLASGHYPPSHNIFCSKIVVKSDLGGLIGEGS